MTHLLCKLFGHVELDQDLVGQLPWDSADFRGHSPWQYREANCLRCSQTLDNAA